jgi:hypothetical protein
MKNLCIYIHTVNHQHLRDMSALGGGHDPTVAFAKAVVSFL